MINDGETSRKARLLFVAPVPPPWAGVEQISQTLLNSPLKDKFDISLIKSNIRDSNREKGAWNLKGISRVLGIGWQIFFHLLRKKPDLVYLTISQNLTGLSRDCFYIGLSKLFSARVVGHFHGSLLHTYLDSVPCLLRGIILYFLRKVDCLIVVSKCIEAGISKYFVPGKIVCVYNVLPISPFLVDRAGRKKLTVSFMGHLSIAKGFYDFVEAAGQILKGTENVSFVCAGERLDEEKNIPSTVILNGARQNWSLVQDLLNRYPGKFNLSGVVSGKAKEEFFKTSDIFVFPSYAESFGLAAFEAMQAGLPVVCSPVGALKERAAEGEHVLFVDPGNKEALIGAMLKLIDQPELREKLGQNARLLLEDFSVDKRWGEYADAFYSVLQKSKNN